jgi:hypothetical protein
MRNVGLLIAGSLVSGLVFFMGCGSNGGGTTGTGGKTSTGTHMTSSSTGTMTTTGHGGGSTSSTTGSGGCGTGGSGPDGGLTGNHCNPVTNMGCASGSSCDYDADMCTGNVTGFSCTMMASVAICGDCTMSNCGPGGTCFFTDASMTTAVCARYCCTDADCGSSGKCDNGGAMPYFGPDSTTLGICVLTTPPDGGSTGPFVCNPPASPASNGSCITVM